MVKFGLNQLDNGWTNKIKCLGFGNWGKHDIFFSQPRERQRELLRLFFLVFFDSSFSSSIPLSRDRFFFLFFVLLRFSFDSFDSPSTSEAIYGQKQAFVVVGRVITGIEAKLKLRGFNLAASHVVHTVGPVYNAEKNPKKLLENAYRNSLRVAKENNIQYIAFTAISCGIFSLSRVALICLSDSEDENEENEGEYEEEEQEQEDGGRKKKKVVTK
ncbi:hypothetical protein YC2023_002839 [Brassica napus]|uniref:(rape) hypothetical protein n=1 Tax=Brassica napus TaxID=3708 RepID=A0A816XXJ8_BRANA|nr:unnamed protein product [Brassica napus]